MNINNITDKDRLDYMEKYAYLEDNHIIMSFPVYCKTIRDAIDLAILKEKDKSYGKK